MWVVGHGDDVRRCATSLRTVSDLYVTGYRAEKGHGFRVGRRGLKGFGIGALKSIVV